LRWCEIMETFPQRYINYVMLWINNVCVAMVTVSLRKGWRVRKWCIDHPAGQCLIPNFHIVRNYTDNSLSNTDRKRDQLLLYLYFPIDITLLEIWPSISRPGSHWKFALLACQPLDQSLENRSPIRLRMQL